MVGTVNTDVGCCIESSVCNLIVADSGHRPHSAAVHWDALNIFLENVMSRALTSEKATNVTEAGTSLLKRLLLFSSPVSCSFICVLLYHSIDLLPRDYSSVPSDEHIVDAVLCLKDPVITSSVLTSISTLFPLISSSLDVIPSVLDRVSIICY